MSRLDQIWVPICTTCDPIEEIPLGNPALKPCNLHYSNYPKCSFCGDVSPAYRLSKLPRRCINRLRRHGSTFALIYDSHHAASKGRATNRNQITP